MDAPAGSRGRALAFRALCIDAVHRRADRTVLLALGIGGALTVAALFARIAHTGRITFAFLPWNLVLALVPYGLALGLRARWRASQRVGLVLVAMGLAWLVFLPNAPYVLTDFCHLRGPRGPRFWFDAALIATCAVTAWVAGLASLAIVEDVLRAAVGRRFARACTVIACGLSGVGIYLGRVLRFNSWDVIGEPYELARAIAERLDAPWHRPLRYAFITSFALLIVGTYATFRLLLRATKPPPERA